ncbi:hypothetical protein [Streptomyces albireticuli]|uniref:Secreted protein n=1 Tax=Streptomyces albireticuli TaxID=1940 RepID=A0A2A2DGM4_9ACTN|nr:hypothetical protein [Streptomyces albireticuli]MCD9142363.1 hypothetical protein [Streptomyces albireticuli]MCD9162383.1 hypothetical protein [Streptomyces albireticuli]MCD9190537.1 hypothetical protein [Streptomyces albireticuli]PAU50607.1 hypothetical protein CK936_01650 [Streptomyces albireticuli]
MSAGTKARIRPGTAQTRLPWWALVLPVVAFVTLLALLTSPASATDAVEPGAGTAGPGTVARVVDFVQHALGRLAA